VDCSVHGSVNRWRDRALVLLMLQGGLRPGKALSLHLEDVQYGRRRVIVRYRTDHPKGARTKSRTERVVDLHEPATLEAVSRYVMDERPKEAETPILFLFGGRGARRCEPLSYAALVKLFRRRCERLGIRAPWLTPHDLRHTHAPLRLDIDPYPEIITMVAGGMVASLARLMLSTDAGSRSAHMNTIIDPISTRVCCWTSSFSNSKARLPTRD